MTDRLSEIRERREAIGPIRPEAIPHGIAVLVDGYETVGLGQHSREQDTRLRMFAPHGIFIARAPADIDWLLARVEELEQMVARLRSPDPLQGALL